MAVTVLFPDDAESVSAFLRRMHATAGELLIILPPQREDFCKEQTVRAHLVHDLAQHSDRLRLLCKHSELVTAARGKGIRVLTHPQELATVLDDPMQRTEVLRVFTPQLWKLHMISQLQRTGLLTMPKLRIYGLVGFSIVLCFFVLFRLLPSAEIRVWPRQETVSQTMNIFLVGSGAVLETNHVRTMPLIPVPVTVTKSLTYDQITKEFLGTPATVAMTMINTADEEYSFRSKTRLVNQAGMVFLLQSAVIVPAHGEATVFAVSDEKDLFGKVIGERGNVPAGVKWEVYGLPPDERTLVYGENRTEAAGGVTTYRTVLTQEDLANARAALERELLVAARKGVDAFQEVWNAEHPDQRLEVLRPQHSELSLIQYFDIVLPTDLLGESVSSVPVEGTITYTMFAYDARSILRMLSDELRAHAREGKELLLDSLSLEHLDVRVIGYSDDFTWIKITADLVGTDRFTLDPLTPTGALFAKNVREHVVGISTADAQRIIKNMPEVESVEVFMWPPWTKQLPTIPAHIRIVPQ